MSYPFFLFSFIFKDVFLNFSSQDTSRMWLLLIIILLPSLGPFSPPPRGWDKGLLSHSIASHLLLSHLHTNSSQKESVSVRAPLPDLVCVVAPGYAQRGAHCGTSWAPEPRFWPSLCYTLSFRYLYSPSTSLPTRLFPKTPALAGLLLPFVTACWQSTALAPKGVRVSSESNVNNHCL